MASYTKPKCTVELEDDKPRCYSTQVLVGVQKWVETACTRLGQQYQKAKSRTAARASSPLETV